MCELYQIIKLTNYAHYLFLNSCTIIEKSERRRAQLRITQRVYVSGYISTNFSLQIMLAFKHPALARVKDIEKHSASAPQDIRQSDFFRGQETKLEKHKGVAKPRGGPFASANFDRQLPSRHASEHERENSPGRNDADADIEREDCPDDGSPEVNPRLSRWDQFRLGNPALNDTGEDAALGVAGPRLSSGSAKCDEQILEGGPSVDAWISSDSSGTDGELLECMEAAGFWGSGELADSVSSTNPGNGCIEGAIFSSEHDAVASTVSRDESLGSISLNKLCLQPNRPESTEFERTLAQNLAGFGDVLDNIIERCTWRVEDMIAEGQYALVSQPDQTLVEWLTHEEFEPRAGLGIAHIRDNATMRGEEPEKPEEVADKGKLGVRAMPDNQKSFLPRPVDVERGSKSGTSRIPRLSVAVK